MKSIKNVLIIIKFQNKVHSQNRVYRLLFFHILQSNFGILVFLFVNLFSETSFTKLHNLQQFSVTGIINLWIMKSISNLFLIFKFQIKYLRKISFTDSFCFMFSIQILGFNQSIYKFIQWNKRYKTTTLRSVIHN